MFTLCVHHGESSKYRLFRERSILCQQTRDFTATSHPSAKYAQGTPRDCSLRTKAHLLGELRVVTQHTRKHDTTFQLIDNDSSDTFIRVASFQQDSDHCRPRPSVFDRLAHPHSAHSRPWSTHRVSVIGACWPAKPVHGCHRDANHTSELQHHSTAQLCLQITETRNFREVTSWLTPV